MKKLCDWCYLNKLTSNFQKNKYTIFKLKCYQNINHLATSLEIDGNRLEDENSPNIILYADDTAIYYAHNQLKELEKQLAVGMKKLCDWCNLNKLTINFQKNKYTIFKPKCYQDINHLATSLEIDGNRLEEVSTYNYT